MASALVVLIVLWWAITSPSWDIEDEFDQPSSPGPVLSPGQVPSSGPVLSSGPVPSSGPRHGTVAGVAADPDWVASPSGQAPRHAASAAGPPQASGGPPWGPAPRPPGLSRADGYRDEYDWR